MLSESELFRVRVAMIQSVLRNESLEAVLITRPGNYAMATGGKRNYVNFATDAGANGLVVTKEGKASFIGDNVEAARQMQEELAGLDCDEYSHLWFEGSVADIIAVALSFNSAMMSPSPDRPFVAIYPRLSRLIHTASLPSYGPLFVLMPNFSSESTNILYSLSNRINVSFVGDNEGWGG